MEKKKQDSLTKKAKTFFADSIFEGVDLSMPKPQTATSSIPVNGKASKDQKQKQIETKEEQDDDEEEDEEDNGSDSDDGFEVVPNAYNQILILQLLKQ
ncbi:unnamed protein product [[Candida] boidinii]|uniref:Unnamed protein product n=1 Tax=Candida boidinii TaxID=5477 RepID=A0ACB5UC78_CANBO|nr:unnamed protein product [[Candida] boidinii]